MKNIILLTGMILVLLTGCAQAVQNDASDEFATEVPIIEPSAIEEQRVMQIEHQKAVWACNTYVDTDLPKLDYADEKTIIFHAYFGLFIYDIQSEKILNSLNLKELGWQKVQGDCDIFVSSDGKHIWIKPKLEETWYLFSWEEDSLIQSEIQNEIFFSKVLSKWDTLQDELGSKIGLCGDHVIEFQDGTYGYLMIEDARITTLTYQRGEKAWNIFTEEACSEPLLLKQDDSYYEAYRIYAQESLDIFLYTYSMFYKEGDYAGICALSKGIEYSDEQQLAWKKQNVTLTQMEEIKGEDENKKKIKCVFRFVDGDKILYLNLVRENGQWYVNGLPQTS